MYQEYIELFKINSLLTSKHITLLLIILCLSHGFFYALQAQEHSYPNPTKPKLVIGLVVDQMRYDYLTRFYEKYGDGGFKKLIRKGFLAKNHHYNYTPTNTAPGHASIYTGTTPMNHGILSNSWYDRTSNTHQYCVGDPSSYLIGTGSANRPTSPKNLLTTTIGDQNRLHTQMKGKSIAIALKDRAAILPSGHTGDAYWFYGKQQGAWITSSYYREKLPQWVLNFNDSYATDNYLTQWNTLYPITTYTESGLDATSFENGFRGKTTPTFPYDLSKLKDLNGGYDVLKKTPFGNSLTVDFALAALKGEKLGRDNVTDFLMISFSATDYIGHNFGVDSKEVEDTYIRLDQDLERLLSHLDTHIGRMNYTLFLTADHGAVPVPKYLTTAKIPSGYFKEATFKNELGFFLKRTFRLDDAILALTNNQVYLNTVRIKEKKLLVEEVQSALSQYILQYNGIDKVITRTQLEQGIFHSSFGKKIHNSFHMQRSGDIFYTLDPGYVVYAHTGSSHGSLHNYDTHVPLIFYGKGIKQGTLSRKTMVTDIAPTIAALLGITAPQQTTGSCIDEVLE